MSIYNALYGRDGHGVGPNEPEKKGFARFCQMVGRDLGQLLGTNLMVCVLCLPAALGVSLGVTLLSLPLTVVCSAVTGLLTGPAMVLLADCALRSLQNDPSQWLPRAKQTLAAHWKAACGFGCIGTLVLGLLCFVSAFVFEAAAQQGYYPGLAILVFLALDFLVLAVLATLCAAVLPLQKNKLGTLASEIHADLAKDFPVDYDETGSIGKRYRRQDEIGTPFTICVDFDTEATQSVTVRDRDTMLQERVALKDLRSYIEERMRF